MHCMISLQIYTLLLYTILHCISSVHLYLTITPTHWELSRRRKVDPEEERLMVMVMDILTSDFTRKCCRYCWCCDIVGRPWWCDGDGVMVMVCVWLSYCYQLALWVSVPVHTVITLAWLLSLPPQVQPGDLAGFLKHINQYLRSCSDMPSCVLLINKLLC